MMSEKNAFTQHVRDLVRGDVTPEELDAAWRKLRDALAFEMRNRGLFTASPASLGIYGFPAWTEEAVDELLADCYTSVFLRRLPSLAAQLEHKANVEGIVFSNIRHYLHEIQRKHDPLGFRVYTVLRDAVRAAVGRGDLRISNGSAEIRNDTVLAAPAPMPQSTQSCGRNGLEAIVRTWADDLLPDLVTARGTALGPVVHRLTEHLARLAEDGTSTFRFQDLSKLLKDQIRRSWGALWARDHAAPGVDRELEDPAWALPPPSRLEEREAFEKLVDRVNAALDSASTSPRTRLYLRRLWDFLWRHAALDNGPLPSQRQLAERLDIPRARFAGLYATLGRTVEECREKKFSRIEPSEESVR